METSPPNPVQLQRTAELVAQFGIDVETPSGRALLAEATDGAPLALPDAPPPNPAPTPVPPTRTEPVVDLISANVQRAALTQPPSPGPKSNRPTWDIV